MKIIVATKQVPARDSSIPIDSAGKWIEAHDLSYEINEPDAYALEAALVHSDDLGLGQTGVVLPEMLGIPHASIIMGPNSGGVSAI